MNADHRAPTASPPNSRRDRLTLSDQRGGLKPPSGIATQAAGDLATLRAAATDLAGPDGVRRVVGRRLALYPQTEMNDGEWAAWWADYTDALGDMALSALEAGMAEWVRRPTSQFMPKPGELRALATSTQNPAQLAYAAALSAKNRPSQNNAWKPIRDDQYERLSLSEKIWHHGKMASYERGKAGAQYLPASEMPEHWHRQRALAQNHEAESKRLQMLMRETQTDLLDLLE